MLDAQVLTIMFATNLLLKEVTFPFVRVEIGDGTSLNPILLYIKVSKLMKGVLGVEVTYPIIFSHAFVTNRAPYLHMTILHFEAQTEIYENYNDLSRTPKPY